MGRIYSDQDNQTEGSATFICCASEDRDIALKLARDVGQPYVEMQLSPEEAPPAPAWNIVDEAPIRACRFLSLSCPRRRSIRGRCAINS